MSAFNLIVLAVAGIAFVLGLRKGLIAQAGQIIALVAGIIACRTLGPMAVEWLSADNPAESSGADSALAYALTFLLVYAAVLLVARLIRGVVHAVHLSILDRLGGAVFKAGVWLLILSIALNVWAALAPSSDLTDVKAHPERARVLDIAPAVCGYVMEQAQKNSHAD